MTEVRSVSAVSAPSARDDVGRQHISSGADAGRWFRRAVSGCAALTLALMVVLSAASAVAAPITAAEDIDWRNATFEVPEVGPCPSQEVAFTDGEGETADHIYRFTPDEQPIYGDVTGEDIQDALLYIDCGPRNSEFTTALVAMTTTADGTTIVSLDTVIATGLWIRRPALG